MFISVLANVLGTYISATQYVECSLANVKGTCISATQNVECSFMS